MNVGDTVIFSVLERRCGKQDWCEGVIYHIVHEDTNDNLCYISIEGEDGMPIRYARWSSDIILRKNINQINDMVLL